MLACHGLGPFTVRPGFCWVEATTLCSFLIVSPGFHGKVENHVCFVLPLFPSLETVLVSCSYHNKASQLSSSSSRNVSLCGSAGWKPEIKGWHYGSLLGTVGGVCLRLLFYLLGFFCITLVSAFIFTWHSFSLCAYMCLNFPFLQKYQSYWIRAHHSSVWPQRITSATSLSQVRLHSKVLRVKISTCEYCWSTVLAIRGTYIS